MPGIFISSKGGQVVVGAGTFTFPITPQGLIPWNTFSATRIDHFQFDVVPEPSLLVLGAIGTGALMRRRRYAGR